MYCMCTASLQQDFDDTEEFITNDDDDPFMNVDKDRNAHSDDDDGDGDDDDDDDVSMTDVRELVRPASSAWR